MALDVWGDMDDDALMALFARGDQSAARALTARHAGRALAVARRMLGNSAEAEDVAQDAMMRLWKAAPNWEPGRARVSTWLYRVTANLCVDRLRKYRETGLEAAPEQADDAPSAVTLLEQDDRAKALHAALRALPERQRLAVTLRHLEELSNPEIAEIMESSVEAVESLLSRGRRALAARLTAQRPALGLTEE